MRGRGIGQEKMTQKLDGAGGWVPPHVSRLEKERTWGVQGGAAQTEDGVMEMGGH